MADKVSQYPRRDEYVGFEHQQIVIPAIENPLPDLVLTCRDEMRLDLTLGADPIGIDAPRPKRLNVMRVFGIVHEVQIGVRVFNALNHCEPIVEAVILSG